MKTIPHVVIVGGGAGGFELAVRLGKKLGKRKLAAITLVDNTLTHLWKPLLHEVAAGTLDSHADELNYLTHASTRHFQFQLGAMEGINRAQREIILAPVFNNLGQEIAPTRKMSYDILIIAVGSTANDFNVPGVKKNCFFLDNREQADLFQQNFLKNLMQAQNQQAPLRPGQLSIAIVGAGATGVELAAELHYTVQQAINYGLDNINLNQDVKLILIEAANRILVHLPERLSRAITQELKDMHVNILAGERVTKVTAEGLQTASGLFIPAFIKVWAAGIRAPDFLRNLDGLEVNPINQLLVKQTLQTTLDENIFAMGDCASCPQPGKKSPVPPRAQAAHQQARLLAKSLTRKIEGKSLLPYVYTDRGSLITLSREGALGNLMGRITGSLMVEGFLARTIYLSLYKTHQITLLGYWRVFLMTLADLLTRRVKPRLKLH